MFFPKIKYLILRVSFIIIPLSGFADAYGFEDPSVNQFSETIHYQEGSVDYWTWATIDTKSSYRYYKNPLVFVEGFDPSSKDGYIGDINWQTMMDEHLDAQAPGLKEQLVNEGYSLIFIDLLADHEDIIGQARSFGRILQLIWNYSNGEPLKIIGFSMGGLVSTEAIYQRNFQNTDNWNFKCNLLVTYDTPHSGAYVPKGVYAFADYLSQKGIPQAQDLRNALTSPAASQMLIFGFTNEMQQTHELWMQHYKTVLSSIKTVANLRRVGVVNGSWDGFSQYESTGQLAFFTDISASGVFPVPFPPITIAHVSLFSQGRTDNYAGGCYTILGSWQDYYHPSNVLNLENSPGGWSNFYKAISDKITDADLSDYIIAANFAGLLLLGEVIIWTGGTTVYYPNNAFINTFSAAGLSYETFGYCTNFEWLESTPMGDMESYSHLDKIYHHKGANQEHCFITEEFRANIVDEIHNATIIPKVIPKVIPIITDFLLDD